MILTGWSVEPLVTDAEPPEETGSTFLENARLKARFGRAHAAGEVWVGGEDSGLEVDGLGGAPGVRSARYAGEHVDDRQNLELLLRELAGLDDEARRARYVCELVCLAPDGRELQASGTLDGWIGKEARGAGGFGYDPVFVPVGETRTVAELGDVWKAERSHRARAACALERALSTAGDVE